MSAAAVFGTVAGLLLLLALLFLVLAIMGRAPIWIAVLMLLLERIVSVWPRPIP